MSKLPIEPPKPERIDHAIGVLRAAVTGIPLVGGSITELFSAFFNTPIARRRDEWFRQIAIAIVELQEQHPGLRLEALQGDERFVSAVLNATAVALKTHRKEKLAALRQAVKSSILLPEIEEDLQAMFLNYIDVLTPWHLRVLSAFDDPNQHFCKMGSEVRWLFRTEGSDTWWSTSQNTFEFMQQAFPDLSDNQFMTQLVEDLAVRNLIGVEGLFKRLPDMGPYTTFTGRKFMRYIGGVSEL